MSDTTTAPSRVIEINPEREAGITSRVGMIIFLASWGMLFGGMFYAYGLLRLGAAAWPPVGSPELSTHLPTLSTVVLLASSITLQLARKALETKQDRKHRNLVWASLVLGVGFIGLQWLVVSGIWEAGLRPSQGAYGSLLFFLTIFHALHVLVGLGVLAYLLPTVMNRIERLRALNRTHIACMYWHFVDLIWIVIFVLIFVI